MSEDSELMAVVDFDCLAADCGKTVEFNLMSLGENGGQVVCPHCHNPYKFDAKFRKKLEKLRVLVLAVQDAQDILGDCNVSINTPVTEVKIPYRLLLTRLNTLISLTVGEHTVDFNFRIEPLNGGAFK
jgi:hypothetical protein